MRGELVKFSVLLCLTLLAGCVEDEPKNDPVQLQLEAIRVGTFDVDIDGSENKGAPIDQPVIIVFKEGLEITSVSTSAFVLDGTTKLPATYSLLDNSTTVSMKLTEGLETNHTYTIQISDQLKGKNGEVFDGFSVDFITTPGELKILSWTIDSKTANDNTKIVDVSRTPTIVVNFSNPVSTSSVSSSMVTMTGKSPGTLSLTWSNNNTTLSVSPSIALDHLNKYRINLSNQIEGANEEIFEGFARDFYTQLDPTPKFPVVSDDELLTLVQQQTFKYFWDFAHPASGMARERDTSGNTVTSGGSGFGVMAIIVAIERNFISRAEGIERLEKIIGFLETADRFHGAWSHWINGNTGSVIPFSADDNGGDLVETAFMIQGLLAVRQYLNPATPEEQDLIDRINAIWLSVEWDWYTQGNQSVLYWHWSPDKGWVKNHKIQGWNEALIIYVLAAASPTHTIDVPVYTSGWARNGAMMNGKDFYGFTLPLGSDRGGPLFFTHYSFLGLDPRNLSDTYADYWNQNVAHTKINRAYCIANPLNYVGYGEANWGLTASDGNSGYSAHSPNNDRGVITPTAALSSFPYTPTESMDALKFFYYQLGDKTWGPYGFYDAFNTTAGWYGDSNIAIDQGPIVVMIENYRTGLLWDLFMSSPEIQNGLTKLGFNY